MDNRQLWCSWDRCAIDSGSSAGAASVSSDLPTPSPRATAERGVEKVPEKSVWRKQREIEGKWKVVWEIAVGFGREAKEKMILPPQQFRAAMPSFIPVTAGERKIATAHDKWGKVVAQAYPSRVGPSSGSIETLHQFWSKHVGPTSRIAHAGPGVKKREGGRWIHIHSTCKFWWNKKWGRVARFFIRGSVRPGLFGSGAHQ